MTARLFKFAVFSVLLPAEAAHAQTFTATQNVRARVQVASTDTLAVATQRAFSFGTFLPLSNNAPGTINVECTTNGAVRSSVPANTGSITTAGRCGEVLVTSNSGSPRYEFFVSPQITAAGSGSGPGLAVTLSEYEVQSDGSVAKCAAQTCGPYSTGTGDTKTFYIGGEIAIPGNVAPGRYRGNFIVTARLSGD